MSFFREIEETAGNVLDLGRLESLHALANGYAEILFAMDHQV